MSASSCWLTRRRSLATSATAESSPGLRARVDSRWLGNGTTAWSRSSGGWVSSVSNTCVTLVNRPSSNRRVKPAPGRVIATEERIRTVLNALPAMVGYWDKDLRNVTANDAYISFFGKSPEEMRGIHIRDLLGPELFEKNRPFIEGALAGEPQLFDRDIPTPSGEVRHTQASYIPDVLDGVVRGFYVLVTDITERWRAEQDVARSRARLAEAERVAQMGSWEWDIPANRITWSDGMFDIYGIRREEHDASYSPGGSDHVHPEDRDRVEAEVRRAVETCAPIDFEYRIIRPDGRVRRLHSRAETVAGADGRPLRFTGTVQDVTEVRAAAQDLQRSAADLGFAHALTTRQLEVLALVAQGLSNAEIAKRLFVAESTVKWHVRKILQALGVANRAQAVARYLEARPPR
jgi:PAS domain S-box-containing protein